MKIPQILLILILFIAGCTTVDKSCHKVMARVTAYHRFQDNFGSQVADPSTKRAIQGITVAADTREFPFGTQILIDNKEFRDFVGTDILTVQDVGSAVTSRKASKGVAPVFDVYLEARNRTDARNKLNRFIREVPDYIEVEIY